ncbi:hypothetical protein D9758_011063 [Tetrapyrgos nigripes]|uniref:Uncharacterized protein n=1 Tax=Tetrapyrgos nigripes TaxID=182062 RepID=A0A8H5CTQ1_9AGAR|nr:hypothetical protein D9758_011063 [Tetrapyrgos nigripes]
MANGHLELRSQLVAFRRIEGSHTGANIAGIFTGVLKDLGAQNSIGMITLDNASNNGTFVQEFHDPREYPSGLGTLGGRGIQPDPTSFSVHDHGIKSRSKSSYESSRQKIPHNLSLFITHKMNPLDLTGKVAVVTGGGTGIGLMIAKQLAKNGAKVYITGRRLEVLQKVATEIGQGLVPLQMDVLDKESITKAVKTINEADGKLDILVNNAGISGEWFKFVGDRDPNLGDLLFAESSFDKWTDILRTNTAAPFFVTMGFLSLLEKGARARKGETSSVINITSCVGTMKMVMNTFAYSVSKAGADHLTSSMATEFGLSKIPVRVNAIAPGVFSSEMTGSVYSSEMSGLEERLVQHMKGAMPGTLTAAPVNRPGKEHEIGMAAVYLSSSAGEYTNGTIMHIDGGLNMVNP